MIDLHKDPDGVYRYRRSTSEHMHDAYAYFQELKHTTIGIDFGFDAGSRVQVDWIIVDEFEKLHLDSTAISGDTSDRGEQSDGISTRQQERQRHLPEDNQSNPSP